MKGGRRNMFARHGERSSETYILDPLLLPRLQQYSYNNNIADIDACVEYLQRNYREYKRKQLLPFRKLVVRAAEMVLKQQQVNKDRSLQKESCSRRKMQQREEGHVTHKEELSSAETMLSSDSDTGSEGFMDEKNETTEGNDTEEESCKSVEGHMPHNSWKGTPFKKRKIQLMDPSSKKAFLGSSDSWEVEDSDDGGRKTSTFNLLNSSLRSTYHGRPALILERPTQSSLPMTDENQQPAMEGERISAPSSDKPVIPPFAPPSVIAETAKAASKKGKNQPGFSRGSKQQKIPDNKIEVKKTKKLSTMGDPGCSSISLGETNRDDQKMRDEQTKKYQDKDNAISGFKGVTSLKHTAEVVRFTDLGNIDKVLPTIEMAIHFLLHPQVHITLGVPPPTGILLYGPPGCGKTKLANAIAYEAGVPFLKISATEVVSGMSGESEAKVRGLFAEAAGLAPCIIFIDEIDAISSKRENAQREMERRIVTQLMTCMDDLGKFSRGYNEDDDASDMREGGGGGNVFVIGATNRPEALDPALRRSGRFDREICLGIPDEYGRAQILSVLTKNLRLAGSVDFKHIARSTPGYVGADLEALIREAGSIAIERIIASRKSCLQSSLEPGSNLISGGHELDLYSAFELVQSKTYKIPENQISSIEMVEVGNAWWKVPWTFEEMQSLSISMQDFEDALVKVQPSAKREGFSAIPDVKWDDIGALDTVQMELQFHISRRIKHPDQYQAFGLDIDPGFLLYGPPGCGKTLVAKAVANEAQANFIYIKGPELLNKYVGESEHSVRALFSRARSCAPCILFFDEIDALAPRRGTDGNAVAERVLIQLLLEMDGAERRKGVFLIAATNRPDILDSAILRSGRLGKHLYLPLPDLQGRISILKALTRQKPISDDVDFSLIAKNKACEGLSGADLAALVHEACVAAIQERISCEDGATDKGLEAKPLLVCNQHFHVALNRISPSVSKKELRYFDKMQKKFNWKKRVTGVQCESYT